MTLSAKINLTHESASAKFHLELEFNIPSDGITALFGPSGSGKPLYSDALPDSKKTPLPPYDSKTTYGKTTTTFYLRTKTHRFGLSKTKPLPSSVEQTEYRIC